VRNGTAELKSGDTFTVTTDVQLYGVWKRVYSVSFAAEGKSLVAADKYTADAGEIITLTILPDQGFMLYEISLHNLTDSTPFPLVPVNDRYTFTMRASDVQVSVKFIPENCSGPTLPETGDSASLLLWSVLVALSSIGMTVTLRRKKDA